MNARRNTWRVAWRIGVCVLLLGWVFYAIFQNEGRAVWERQGGQWETLAWGERWHFAWVQGSAALLGTLALIRPGEGLLSLGFMGLTILLGALRWHMVLRSQQIGARLPRVLEISMVAHFFNAFLLGSTGGDLFKAYYAAGETHDRKAESVVSVVVDRLLGLLSMLVFAAVMMVPNHGLLLANPRLGALALVALGMLATLVIIGGLSFQGGLTRFWPGARDWLRRLPKGESLERALEALRWFGRQRVLLGKAFGLSMLLNVACVLQIWALVRGLGLQVQPIVLFTIVPIIICLAALPITPSGLGVRENLYVVALAAPQIGVPATAALSLSLLAYAGSLFWSLVGGLVYVRFRRAHPRPRAVTDETGQSAAAEDRAP